ncbi:hypothetical protein Tco_0046020 [Tanacetum coccineum]
MHLCPNSHGGGVGEELVSEDENGRCVLPVSSIRHWPGGLLDTGLRMTEVVRGAEGAWGRAYWAWLSRGGEKVPWREGVVGAAGAGGRGGDEEWLGLHCRRKGVLETGW